MRHVDHVRAVARGGETGATNAQGLCEACNYSKEAPGWRADVIQLGGHVVEFTTPFGRRYRGKAPPAPGHEPRSPEDAFRRARDDWTDGLGA